MSSDEKSTNIEALIEFEAPFLTQTCIHNCLLFLFISFLEALKIHNKLLGTCQSVKYSRTCFLKVKMTSSTLT